MNSEKTSKYQGCLRKVEIRNIGSAESQFIFELLMHALLFRICNLLNEFRIRQMLCATLKTELIKLYNMYKVRVYA